MLRWRVHDFGKSMGTKAGAAQLGDTYGKYVMTLPALILVSLLALIALPVVSQITGGSSGATDPTGIHGSKDSGTGSTNPDDGPNDRP